MSYKDDCDLIDRLVVTSLKIHVLGFRRVDGRRDGGGNHDIHDLEQGHLDASIPRSSRKVEARTMSRP